MPVIRRPDGEIVVEPTVRSSSPKSGGPSRAPSDDKTTVLRPDAEPSAGHVPDGSGFGKPTVVGLPGDGVAEASRTAPEDGQRTVVFGQGPEGGEGSDLVGFVAGWLVVVAGPGKGHDLRVCVGRNSIGRDSSKNLIALDFGDKRISREAHLWITYDHENRRFSVEPGGSPNLAQLNNAGINAPKELSDGDEIRVGSTKLRFVALCGDNFNWPDED